MEKNINKRIENYVTGFKDSIRSKITELEFQEKPKINELLEYVYDYNRLVLTKEDFVKRKRVKNAIPTLNRCNARRANGEQCTRRKKDDYEYCGTHLKGTPHGICDKDAVNDKQQGHKVEVWVQDIQGIVYYIDKTNNVYQAEDILSNKVNPKIIAKYVKNGEQYSIPEFNI
jgi:hypothetical protein